MRKILLLAALLAAPVAAAGGEWEYDTQTAFDYICHAQNDGEAAPRVIDTFCVCMRTEVQKSVTDEEFRIFATQEVSPVDDKVNAAGTTAAPICRERARAVENSQAI